MNTIEPASGVTPLILAIQLNRTDIIHWCFGLKTNDEGEQVYTKKPMVNVSQTDSDGRAALFHVIQPCKEGTFMNTELTKIVVDFSSAAVLSQKVGGKSLIEFCFTAKNYAMAEALANRNHKVFGAEYNRLSAKYVKHMEPLGKRELQK